MGSGNGGAFHGEPRTAEKLSRILRADMSEGTVDLMMDFANHAGRPPGRKAGNEVEGVEDESDKKDEHETWRCCFLSHAFTCVGHFPGNETMKNDDNDAKQQDDDNNNKHVGTGDDHFLEMADAEKK